MSIDNDNSDYEAKRLEQRRAIEKQQAKAMQEKDPLRSFEAKLSKEASREEAARESLRKPQQELKKEIEEKSNILRRVLGDKASDSASDLTSKARQHEAQFAKQKDLQKKGLDEKLRQKTSDRDKDDHADAKAKGETTEAGDSASGDQRVLGIPGEGADEGEGFAGGQSFGGGTQNSDSDDAQKFGEAQFDKNAVVGSVTFSSLKDLGADSGSHPQRLTPEDLDEIVDKIQHGFLQNGEEVFSVQLQNEFYEGLQIQSQRTPAGVVLTLICPNVLVRTQMARCKDDIAKRLADKNIKVKEVRFT